MKKILDFPVTLLVTAAFRTAALRYPELHQTWIRISYSLGSLLPRSIFMMSVQQTAELDMVLRCMEDDFSPPQESVERLEVFSGHYQMMLSELWVGAVYEIFRLLESRKLVHGNNAFKTLSHDLRMLRVPIEKHEIAADRKLSAPLLLQGIPPNHDQADMHSYSKSDPSRSHIMPKKISSRGSPMWQVIDVASEESYWLERRNLSERIVDLWKGDIGALTAQKNSDIIPSAE